MKRLAVVWALLAAGGSAYADSVDGRKFVIATSGSPFGSASEACQAVYDNESPPHPKSPFMFISPTATGVTSTSFSCSAQAQQSDGEGGWLPWFTTVLASGSVESCVAPADMAEGGPCAPPPPELCEDDIGDGQWQVSTSPISGAKWCQNGCTITAGSSQCSGPPGLTTCTTWAAVTSQTCSGSGGEPEGDDPPPPGSEGGDEEEGAGPPEGAGEGCIPVGDGEYCASSAGDGDCGYMNDTYICLENVAEGECKVLGDGGRVCDADARTTPPVPDNGTPGQTAEADGVLGQTTTGAGGSTVTNIFNYFNGGTVGGSSRDPGTDGGASNGGSPNGGDQGVGDGEGGECSGPTCGEAVPELADVGTMTEAFTGFWEDLQGVPIIDAAADVAPSFGSGTCPVWSDSFSVFGQTIEVDFSGICDLWADVGDVVSIVALVLWGLLAFRVLFSA